MNGKRDISDLNVRVTIKSWEQTQDAGAGTYYTEESSFDTWANKKNVSGSQFNNQAQQQWGYDTTFTIRYNARVVPAMTVDDTSGRWLINSIEVDNEGYKGMMKLRCIHTDINLNVS